MVTQICSADAAVASTDAVMESRNKRMAVAFSLPNTERYAR